MIVLLQKDKEECFDTTRNNVLKIDYVASDLDDKKICITELQFPLELVNVATGTNTEGKGKGEEKERERERGNEKESASEGEYVASNYLIS